MQNLFELGLYLKATVRELERTTNAAMAAIGITAAQADALVVISDLEPVSLKDIGALLIAESGHPSRLVDRLVRGGYVVRDEAPDDGRKVLLSLTERGSTAARAALRVRADILRTLASSLPPSEVDRALELFRTLSAGSAVADLVSGRIELERRRTKCARRT